MQCPGYLGERHSIISVMGSGYHPGEYRLKFKDYVFLRFGMPINK
jgi:hypothetical protein